MLWQRFPDLLLAALVWIAFSMPSGVLHHAGAGLVAIAMGAIRESWRRTAGHSWRIVRLWLVGLVLVAMGALLLGVGIVPAAMWAHVAFAALFVRITSADREAYPSAVPSRA